MGYLRKENKYRPYYPQGSAPCRVLYSLCRICTWILTSPTWHSGTVWTGAWLRQREQRCLLGISLQSQWSRTSRLVKYAMTAADADDKNGKPQLVGTSKAASLTHVGEWVGELAIKGDTSATAHQTHSWWRCEEKFPFSETFFPLNLKICSKAW